MFWVIIIIFGLVGDQGEAISIIASERSPGCNPVAENSDLILKVGQSALQDNFE